jgi:hypothetical protein
MTTTGMNVDFLFLISTPSNGLLGPTQPMS